MSALKNGGPAFPHANDGHNGMTLRDYFAAKVFAHALQVRMETPPDVLPLEAEVPMMAKLAYIAADAMLKARQA